MKDDAATIECPNCGAVVYEELTRCPRCGQSFYPLDEEDEGQSPAISEPGWMVMGAGVLAGVLAAGGLAFLVFYLARRVQPGGEPATGMQLFLSAVGVMSALVGGYVAGLLGRIRTAWLGLVVGVLSLGWLAVLLTPWDITTLRALAQPVWLAAGILVLLAGWAGGWISARGGRADRGADFEAEYRLYRELLAKVRFNKDTAERLIGYEQGRRPRAKRLELIRSAIERWERDNG